MTSHHVILPKLVMQPPLYPPSIQPVLSLSSAQVGWKDLLVQAFHEPATYDQWLMESTPTIALVFFFGGAMRLEWRHRYGAWNTRVVHHGEVNLSFGWE